MAGVGTTPLYDQRDAPHGRVEDGAGDSTARMDMGAVESQPQTISGDFNNDGFWDCDDINALTAVTAAGTNDPSFDLTGDGLVNANDIDAWLAEAGAMNPAITGGNPFLLADADLNGFVDAVDFTIWNSNKFSPQTDFCQGNFDGNTVVDAVDFTIWNDLKFLNSDQSNLVVADPGASPFSRLHLDGRIRSTDEVFRSKHNYDFVPSHNGRQQVELPALRTVDTKSALGTGRPNRLHDNRHEQDSERHERRSVATTDSLAVAVSDLRPVQRD